MPLPSLHCAIPALAESTTLPLTLEDLVQASHHMAGTLHIWILVNEPAHCSDWMLKDNEECIRSLCSWPHASPNLHLIDGRTTPFDGVGGVRDALGRLIAKEDPQGWTICLDGDTRLPALFLHQIQRAISSQAWPWQAALLPYFHPTPRPPREAANLLRYEIYMRHYTLGLLRSGSPHAGTTLGSALIYQNQAFSRHGGFPHRKAGEDFYFAQKFSKMGRLCRFVPTCVRPSGRPSTRVPFGTGPIVAQVDDRLQQQRFPLFAPKSFSRLRAAFEDLPAFFQQGQPSNALEDLLSVHPKMKEKLKKNRENYARFQDFQRAFHATMDGLKTLQALRMWSGEDQPLSLPQLARVYQMHPFDENHLPDWNLLRCRLMQLEWRCLHFREQQTARFWRQNPAGSPSTT
jgi:hypothetical protein